MSSEDAATTGRAAEAARGGGVRVRPARAGDRDFILSLVPRLVEFGPPRWHDPARMSARDSEAIAEALASESPEIAVFVAEDGAGNGLGFIHLNTAADYFTREKHGHVSDIVVARGGEGRGVGRVLMLAGEEWARSRGYKLIALGAFSENRRARRLYEQLGYEEDIVRYVKELG